MSCSKVSFLLSLSFSSSHPFFLSLSLPFSSSLTLRNSNIRSQSFLRFFRPVLEMKDFSLVLFSFVHEHGRERKERSKTELPVRRCVCNREGTQGGCLDTWRMMVDMITRKAEISGTSQEVPSPRLWTSLFLLFLWFLSSSSCLSM